MSDEEPQRIRAAFDIDIPAEVAKEVEKALHNNRKIICDFLIDVIARNDDKVDASKLKGKAIAGGAHVHDASSGKCTVCDAYARAAKLYEV